VYRTDQVWPGTSHTSQIRWSHHGWIFNLKYLQQDRIRNSESRIQYLNPPSYFTSSSPAYNDIHSRGEDKPTNPQTPLALLKRTATRENRGYGQSHWNRNPRATSNLPETLTPGEGTTGSRKPTPAPPRNIRNANNPSHPIHIMPTLKIHLRATSSTGYRFPRTPTDFTIPAKNNTHISNSSPRSGPTGKSLVGRGWVWNHGGRGMGGF
jgi:hypothetical protein